jgi:ActR/RegA family two-component response regulator
VSAFAAKNAGQPWLLVVDDDPVTARSLSRLLSAGTGARVAVVHSVDDALRLVARAAEDPALAILDFELAQGETGLNVLLSLRASGSEVPCVFHTGVPVRVAAALEASRLGRAYPIFAMGLAQDELVTWAQGVVASASMRRSGTRRRAITS